MEDICDLLSFTVKNSSSGRDPWLLVSFEPSHYLGDMNRHEQAGLGLTTIYKVKEYGNEVILHCAAKLATVNGEEVKYGKYDKITWMPFGCSKTHSFKETKITATGAMIDANTFFVSYTDNGIKSNSEIAIFTFLNETLKQEIKDGIYLFLDKETGIWIGIKTIFDTCDIFSDIHSALIGEKKEPYRLLCQKGRIIDTPMLISIDREKERVIKHIKSWKDLSRYEILNIIKKKWNDYFAFQLLNTNNINLKKTHYYGMYIAKVNEVEPCVENPPGINHPAIFPSKPCYRGVWVWDTAYLTVPLIPTCDYKICEGALLTHLDNQREDGSIPICILSNGEQPLFPKISQPPLLSMDAFIIYKAKEYFEDKERAINFLKLVYQRLKNFNNFWYKKRDRDKDGFCEYTSRNLYGFNYSYESGVDDSPYWDEAGGEAVEDIALNIFLVLDKRYLVRMAKLIGEEYEPIEREALEIEEKIINEFYDPETGLFFPRRSDSHNLIKIKTFECLLPLLLDNLSDEKKENLVKHLLNSDEFWTPYPVPTVAKDDPAYGTRWGAVCWRKPVWMCVNWWLARGLVRHQYYNQAEVLINKTIELVLNSAQEEYGRERFAENYDPEIGKKSKDGYAYLFGWNGLVTDMITSLLGGIDFLDTQERLTICPISSEEMTTEKMGVFCHTKLKEYTFGFNKMRVATLGKGIRCDVLEDGFLLTAKDRDLPVTFYGDYLGKDIKVVADGKEIGRGKKVNWIQETFPIKIEIITLN
ncbi:hypothetical protein KAX02_01875 [candidate division WOR-3 bacterium]|nr:hypothetical protein [candidate division WOR-3 bacterium]